MSSSQNSTSVKGSFVVPVYNEEANILPFYAELSKVLQSEIASRNIDDYEIIFINDGSTDNSKSEILKILATDSKLSIIDFSRNFGKEAATSAGLHNATGDFVIMLDSDLQHPIELVPEFIAKWRAGSDVVVGKIIASKSALHKRLGRKVFYYILSKIQDDTFDMTGNDYRLIDRQVVESFVKFEEQGRSTRNLIDWLGFERAEIPFTPKSRIYGEASYTSGKLFTLAINSIVSNSLFPLRIASYLGILIFICSSLLGAFIFVEKYLLNDMHGFKFSYPAILAVVNMFLISIVLICLGLVAMYVGHIKHEVLKRPLYVVKKNRRSIQ